MVHFKGTEQNIFSECRIFFTPVVKCEHAEEVLNQSYTSSVREVELKIQGGGVLDELGSLMSLRSSSVGWHQVQLRMLKLLHIVQLSWLLSHMEVSGGCPRLSSRVTRGLLGV